MAEARQRESWTPFAWLKTSIFGGEMFNPFERKKASKRATLSPTESVSFLAGLVNRG